MDVACVTLEGELDLETAAYVRESVSVCLEQQPRSLRLDVRGLFFCDCAGLSALLEARRSALGAGVGFSVEGIGMQLARLLHLIGADGIFAEGDAPAGTTSGRCTSGAVTAHSDAEAVAVTGRPLPDRLA
nr:STAS domain-containing protein [Streptomyces sp. SID9727]